MFIREKGDKGKTNVWKEAEEMAKKLGFGFGDFCSVSKIKTNIIHHEDSYKLTMLLPGFSRDEIELEITSEKLEVKAKKKNIEGSYGTSEVTQIEFEPLTDVYRGFSLSDANIDTGNVKAELKDGVLTIILYHKKLEKNKVSINIA